MKDLSILDRLETLPSHELTFVAEELGQEPVSERIQSALLKLLDNPSAVVREGAIYGLSNYLTVEEVYNKIKQLAINDPSPGVKRTAADFLSQR